MDFSLDEITKKSVALIVISIILIIPSYSILSKYLSERSAEEKLGYVPKKEVLRIASVDHKSLVSEWLFLKTIIYYGGKIDPAKKIPAKGIEYYNMYRLLDASTYIDPYNIDSYYFAEAVFTWDLGKIKEVNYLLERGVKYRTWDFYPPFFLAFNYYYFLRDYKQASFYMKKAAEITKDPLFTNLAARFMYETGETDIAINFLKLMIENTWNKKVRYTLEVRLKALEAVSYLEKGVKRFIEIYKRKPINLEELVYNHVVDRIPDDPYGGRFYIDEKGKIRTTSKFAYQREDGNIN
jgi:tetratricopeptide (TPR) repeat protein